MNGQGHVVKVDHPAGAADWTVQIDDGRTPFLVILRFIRDDGEWRCSGFELKRRPDAEPPEPVRAEALHYFAEEWENFYGVARSHLDFSVAEAVRETASLRARGQGRRGLPDDFYRAIADQYRQALARDDKPTSTIAEAHSVARSTASNWIAEARKRGYLEPATPGRAG